MQPSRRNLAFSLLAGFACALFVMAAVFAMAAAPSAEPAVQSDTANALFVPGLVANAEGTYAPYATATPAPTATPTPVGVQDAPNHFFVASNGDDANPGTRDEPFATIARGLEVAFGVENAEIYVSSYYSQEPIAIIEQSVGIFGGYDSNTWERDDNSYSVIAPIDSQALTIGASSDVTVEGFDLRSGPTAMAAPLDLSSIAVLIEVSSNVHLVDNIVHSDDGLDGAAGMSGVGGDIGFDGHNGDPSGVCPPTNEGGAGGKGPTNGGAGGAGGAINGFDGQPGGNVAAGVQGGHGGGGGSFPGGAGGKGGKGDDGHSIVTPARPVVGGDLRVSPATYPPTARTAIPNCGTPGPAAAVRWRWVVASSSSAEVAAAAAEWRLSSEV